MEAHGGTMKKRATVRRTVLPSEHAEQVMLFQRLRVDARTRHALIFAIPNFSGRGGLAALRQGVRLKAEGRMPGVSDIFVAEPRAWATAAHPLHQCHGLWVELKRIGNTITPEQRDFLDKVSRRGYATAVCYSADAAFDTIVSYLGGN
jgi:hypothetical protein